MVNYSNAKIYKIVDNTSDMIYVGSTTKTLAQRLGQHRADYQKYLKGTSHFITSYKILENNNYDIILLEEFKDCENKDQLKAKERYYIETLNCINKVIPGRPHKEYRKIYYQENKNKIMDYGKKYYENNKETINIKNQLYYETNKDKINLYHKEYIEANKDKIKKRRQEYYLANRDRLLKRQADYRASKKSEENKESLEF